MVRCANALSFAGSASGVGAADDASVHAVAVLYFFAEVPGGCAARHDDFVENPEDVAFFDRADAGHWVDVKVNAQEQGEDWEVLDFFGNVVVGKADCD